MELKKIQLNNGETYAYREAGKGEKVLLLIHGNASSSMWWDVIIERLQKKFKIYAPDIRGFGDSSYNIPLGSVKDMAEDIKLFADALGLKGFTTVGLSLGGVVSMELAINYPEYVSQMILLESGSVQGLPVQKRNFLGKPIPGKFVSTKEDVIKYNKALIKAYEKKNYRLLKFAFNKTVFNVNKPDPERYQTYIEATCKQRNKIDADMAVVNFNISHEHNGIKPGTGEVDKITCPVLVLNGDKDLVIPMEMAEYTTKEIGDNARLVVLKDAAHGATIDQPDKIAEEITAFAVK